jgi:N-acetyl-anhydromuramyl-L-alanine amidase AmpD
MFIDIGNRNFWKGKSMSKKEKYILAAKNLVELGLKSEIYGYACNSIKQLNVKTYGMLREFQEMFRPNDYVSVYWGSHTGKKNNLARSIALLLMAEMEGTK